jgi:hypothetical protein
MTMTYRADKGSPLTIDEMDDNFREIIARVEALENNPPVGETIADIRAEGDHLIIHGTHGSQYGPFQLPVISLTPQGEWQPRRDYVRNDCVLYQGILYLCTNTHTAGDVFYDVNWVHVMNEAKPILPTYATGTLPEVHSPGEMGLYVDDTGVTGVIYSDGQSWRRLVDQMVL